MSRIKINIYHTKQKNIPMINKTPQDINLKVEKKHAKQFGNTLSFEF